MTSDPHARAAEAKAAARAADEAALAADAARWDRRVEEQPKLDRQLLDSFDDHNRELIAEERRQREAFESAVVGSDFGRAWIGARAAHFRRQRLADDARAAAGRLDERSPGESDGGTPCSPKTSSTPWNAPPAQPQPTPTKPPATRSRQPTRASSRRSGIWMAAQARESSR